MPENIASAVGSSTSETVPDSGNFLIDNILSGSRWTASNLTYSFPTSGSLYDYYPKGDAVTPSGFQYGNGETLTWYWYAQHVTFTDAQKAAAQDVFSQVSSFTNLTFTEAGETASSHADLRFSQLKTVYESGKPPISGSDPSMVGEPGKVPQGSERAEAGDAWLSVNSFYDTAPDVGTLGYFNIMRAVAGTLGLETGGNSLDTSIFFGQTLGEAYDFNAYFFPSSLMPQSLMQQDIAALQYLYGANFSINSGATTYRWDPVTGEQSVDGVGQGVPFKNFIYRTIWDGGGEDTYDLSNYTTDLDIDLEPGAFSTFSKAQLAQVLYAPGDIIAYHNAAGNVANALLYQDDTRSLIENAVGGAGNDSMKGNLGINHLSGGIGDDRLQGRGGDDILKGEAGQDGLVGGTGSDVLEGGAGADVLYGDDLSSGVGLGSGLVQGAIYRTSAGDDAIDITNSFYLFDDPNVTSSDTVPHVTIRYGAEKKTWMDDYYKIHVTAGTTLTMDVDGLGAYNILSILDSKGKMLDNAYTYSYTDPGTTVYGDTLLIYTVQQTGDFYIRHSSDRPHDLHVSAEGPGTQIDMGSGLITKTADQILRAPSANFTRDNFPYALDLTQSFSLAADPNIGDSTTTPHVTVKASTEGNGYDFYHVRLEAGSVVTIDIDGTTPRETTDTTIRLFDASGSLSSFPANDNMNGVLDPGSTNPKDSFLTYTIEDTGDYWIMISNNYNRPYDYTLNVSVKERDHAASDGGIDTASYADTSAAVTASLGDPSVNTGDAKGDRYISVENLTGSDFADKLSGDKAANLIDGGKGHDVLSGGGGDDRLVGGAGSDTAVFTGRKADYTITTAADGTVTVADGRSGASSDGTDRLTGIETLRFSDGDVTPQASTLVTDGGAFTGTVAQFLSYTAIRGSVSDLSVPAKLVVADGGALDLSAALGSTPAIITGSAAGNEITTGAGDDRLLQTLNDLNAGGVTRFHGGGGSDTLELSATGGPVTSIVRTDGSVAFSAGGRTVIADADVERFVVNGSSEGDTLAGSGGGDWLDGRGGADTYRGSAGNDAYVFSSAGDKVVGEGTTGGTDTIWSTVSVDLRAQSGIENLRFWGQDDLDATGNALQNVITGNAGDNVITGGGGYDKLYGKGGADTFVYAEFGAANRDLIMDFDSNDRIVLSKLAFLGLGGSAGDVLLAEDFAFDAATAGHAQIVYDRDTGILSYDADGTGSAAAGAIARIGKNAGFFGHEDILFA